MISPPQILLLQIIRKHNLLIYHIEDKLMTRVFSQIKMQERILLIFIKITIQS